MKENISTVAGKLDPNRFARIHRSTIVNVSRIKEVHSGNSGEYMVVLRGVGNSLAVGYIVRLYNNWWTLRSAEARSDNHIRFGDVFVKQLAVQPLSDRC